MVLSVAPNTTYTPLYFFKARWIVLCNGGPSQRGPCWFLVRQNTPPAYSFPFVVSRPSPSLPRESSASASSAALACSTAGWLRGSVRQRPAAGRLHGCAPGPKAPATWAPGHPESRTPPAEGRNGGRRWCIWRLAGAAAAAAYADVHNVLVSMCEISAVASLFLPSCAT
jgi:hypothetical protein